MLECLNCWYWFTQEITRIFYKLLLTLPTDSSTRAIFDGIPIVEYLQPMTYASTGKTQSETRFSCWGWRVSNRHHQLRILHTRCNGEWNAEKQANMTSTRYGGPRKALIDVAFVLSLNRYDWNYFAHAGLVESTREDNSGRLLPNVHALV